MIVVLKSLVIAFKDKASLYFLFAPAVLHKGDVDPNHNVDTAAWNVFPASHECVLLGSGLVHWGSVACNLFHLPVSGIALGRSAIIPLLVGACRLLYNNVSVRMLRDMATSTNAVQAIVFVVAVVVLSITFSAPALRAGNTLMMLYFPGMYLCALLTDTLGHVSKYTLLMLLDFVCISLLLVGCEHVHCPDKRDILVADTPSMVFPKYVLYRSCAANIGLIALRWVGNFRHKGQWSTGQLVLFCDGYLPLDAEIRNERR